jgi:hypothetical protein
MLARFADVLLPMMPDWAGKQLVLDGEMLFQAATGDQEISGRTCGSDAIPRYDRRANRSALILRISPFGHSADKAFPNG